jgi:hypothetical protein
MPEPKASTDTGRRRDSVDSGRTGDKVPWPDPAAAPLETGAEAAGQPTPKRAAEADRRHQEEIAASADRYAEPMSAAATPERRRMNRRFAVWLGVVLAVVALVAVFTALALVPT